MSYHDQQYVKKHAKLCPFCGGKAVGSYYGPDRYVICDKCGSSSPKFSIRDRFVEDEGAYEKALKCWNKRVEKPKRKVVKEVVRYMNIDEDGTEYTCLNEMGANLEANSDRIACVKLTGTYEVEE